MKMIHEMSKHDFFNWCMTQPDSRDINHGNGWCGCAVGDWVKAQQIQIEEDTYPNPAKMNDVNYGGLDENDEEDEYTLDCPVIETLSSAQNGHDTYGELKTLITSHYPKYGETHAV